MKKHYALFCGILLIAATATAQGPTITSVNLPQIGDVTTIAICSENAVEPGPSGMNQTWDMSELNETEEQAFTYVQPEGTYWSNDFPNAGVCGISWMEEYSYYNYSEDSLTAVGYGTILDELNPSDTAKVIYDDPESFIPLPFSFDNVHTDEFSGINITPILDVPFEGEVEFEADGYGTLILPTGTYDDVVRYHFTREQVNNGPVSVTQTKEQWGWISASHRFWLMIQEINNDGFNESELIWYDKNPLPVTTGLSSTEDLSFSVFPNPASVGEELSLHWDRSETAQVILTSISGQILIDRQMNLSQGVNGINLESLEASEGIYLLQMISARGTGTTKVVLSR